MRGAFLRKLFAKLVEDYGDDVLNWLKEIISGAQPAFALPAGTSEADVDAAVDAVLAEIKAKANC